MSLDKLRMVFAELTNMADWADKGANFDDAGTMILDIQSERLPAIRMLYQASEDRLLIFAETRAISSVHEVAVYRELMERQFLYQHTPGVTFAISRDSLALTAQLRLVVETLTVQELGNALMAFVDELEILTEIISRTGPQEMAPEMDGLPI